MKRLMTITLCLLAWCLATPAALAGGEAPQAIGTPQSLSGDLDAAREGWQRIHEGALLIDVRSTKEFEDGHLEDALNIVHTDIDALAAAIGEDHDRSVVLYCGSGRRAGRAQSALEERGYTGIFNASGLDALQATRD